MLLSPTPNIYGSIYPLSLCLTDSLLLLDSHLSCTQFSESLYFLVCSFISLHVHFVSCLSLPLPLLSLSHLSLFPYPFVSPRILFSVFLNLLFFFLFLFISWAYPFPYAIDLFLSHNFSSSNFTTTTVPLFSLTSPFYLPQFLFSSISLPFFSFLHFSPYSFINLILKSTNIYWMPICIQIGMCIPNGYLLSFFWPALCPFCPMSYPLPLSLALRLVSLIPWILFSSPLTVLF